MIENISYINFWYIMYTSFLFLVFLFCILSKYIYKMLSIVEQFSILNFDINKFSYKQKIQTSLDIIRKLKNVSHIKPKNYFTLSCLQSLTLCIKAISNFLFNFRNIYFFNIYFIKKEFMISDFRYNYTQFNYNYNFKIRFMLYIKNQ